VKNSQKLVKNILTIPGFLATLSHLPFRKRELPQQRNCPSAIMATRSPSKSASSLQNNHVIIKSTEILSNSTIFFIPEISTYRQRDRHKDRQTDRHQASLQD